ncbi:MAG: hypothetical protein ICV83_28835, partial [Cytophagales bacterium]|nr:hypothetical protein [Cytophagales bacterium]
PLQAFPLTANGKLDLKGLPALNELLNARAAGGGTARNVREEKIAGIWREVLNAERIGIFDNFFSVGGHSLNAIKVIARIHEELGVKIELGGLFRTPTIEGLALLVEGAESTPDQVLVPLSGLPSYEVSHAQKRLWIMDQLEAERVAYNLPVAYAIEGSLDITALEAALHALTERHEALRTVFLSSGGELTQQIKGIAESGFVLRYLDLRGRETTSDQVRALVNQEAGKPFALDEGPLLHATVWQLTENNFVLLLALHHIIVDDRSVQVILSELLTLYTAHLEGQADALPPLRLQYKDFAAWQNRELGQEGVQQHRSYWIDRFQQQAPVLNLPTDFDRAPLKRFQGEQLAFALEADLAGKLQLLGRQSEATVFMCLVAVVKATLFKYTSQTDIVIGTSISGRDKPEFENLVGLFLNQLPLRTGFSAEDTFLSLLGKVKETTLEAYEHKMYPFDKLVDDLKLERDPSRSPLFDVMVDFKEENDALGRLSEREDFTITRFENAHTVSKFDFDIVFTQSADNIWGVIEYDTDLFRSDTMALFIRRLLKITEQVVEHPDLPLEAIDGRTDEELELERDLLSIEFNF